MKRLYFILLFSLLLHTEGSSSNLSLEQAQAIAREYYEQQIENFAQKIDQQWQAGALQSGQYSMPFALYINGTMPDDGYPLYISMHGGGGAPAEVNDQQWENQKNLYGVVDGLYFVPRSPTDSWNMWHQEYMDDFIMQVISYTTARLMVNPSKVYLLGYSAGGDGVYNLATRLSDKFAAAAMMAGHPGDAQVENLRNLPFALYVGELDNDYNRAQEAYNWMLSLQRLNAEDPGGFNYNANIFAGKGHWMDGLDGEAIGWLSGHRRVSCPSRVVWIQDDVLHTLKYNLEVKNPQQGFRLEQIVERESNTIYINSDNYDEVTIWLDDFIVDLNHNVRIIFNGEERFNGIVERQERNIKESIDSRLDPEYVYWGKITIQK